MGLRRRLATAVWSLLVAGPAPGAEEPTPEPQPPSAWRASLKRASQRAGEIIYSFAVSIAVHLALVFVLSLIVLSVRAVGDDEAVAASLERLPPPEAISIDPELDAPADASPEPADDPEFTTDDHDVALDVPSGTDLRSPVQPSSDLDSVPLDAAALDGGFSTGAYGQRSERSSLWKEGGSSATVDAVEAALRWLARHQSAGGSWDDDGWRAECQDETCQGRRRDAEAVLWEEDHDVGLTSLSLLAFLGHGQTHRVGKFKTFVHRGFTWLKRQQQADGSFGVRRDSYHWMYDHALATLALAEAYALTRDFSLRKPLERAVRFAVEARNPGAGWRYAPRDGESDTSVTGWFVLALKAARVGGFDVPDEAFAGADAWFVDMTDPATGRVGYMHRGGGESGFDVNGRFTTPPTNTSVAVACRFLTGEKPSELQAGIELILEHPPAWPLEGEARAVNFYYWYYGTHALFQAGGERWRRWNQAMQEALLPHQRTRGCAHGSWEPLGEWCMTGGRVYATAINALTLEIYYRYRRVRDTPTATITGGG